MSIITTNGPSSQHTEPNPVTTNFLKFLFY